MGALGRWTAAALVLAGGSMLAAGGALAQTPQQVTILHAELDDETITPVIEAFLARGVTRASSEGHEALLVELDTPGGLDTSMRDIVEAFLDAETPVIVYVPQGARAASAGAVIGFSAHVLAMAPATSIGAATPIGGQGGEDLERKIVNEAASYVAAVARERGRDVAFARRTVTEGAAADAEEALRLGAIDLIARDLDALLRATDGTVVELPAGPVTLRTRGAVLVPYDLSLLERIRQRLADPNLAFLFLSLGSLALVYELANPGIAAAGFVGVILLLLGFFGVSVLPVNTVGVLLLVLALGLFIGEVFTPGVGAFAAGGVTALILGGLFLFEGTVDVSLAVLIPVAVTVGGLVAVAGRYAWRARVAPSVSGAEGIVGRVATVKRIHDGVAQVFLEGAWWRVRGPEALAVGTEVRVRAVDGLDLVVDAVAAAPQEGEG